jgi:hypothetical protein
MQDIHTDLETEKVHQMMMHRLVMMMVQVELLMMMMMMMVMVMVMVPVLYCHHYVL